MLSSNSRAARRVGWPAEEQYADLAEPTPQWSSRLCWRSAARPRALRLEQRFRTSAERVRSVHAIKTALAAVLAACLELIDPVQRLTKGTGVWAVMTVLIVMQTQTVGGTTHKTANRIVGTVIAALGALAVGYLAALTSSETWPYLPAILVGFSIIVVTSLVTYISSAKAWAEWSYAFFLIGLTFDFLVLLEFRDDWESGVYRILMILGGAIIALVVTVAPPAILASVQLKGLLVDNLLDSAQATTRVVAAFTSGQTLHRISKLAEPGVEYACHCRLPSRVLGVGRAARRKPLAASTPLTWSLPVPLHAYRCEIHASYQAILASRSAYEAAVSAAQWEEYELCGGADWGPYKEVGLHVRRCELLSLRHQVASLARPLGEGTRRSHAKMSSLHSSPASQIRLCTRSTG